MAHTVVALSLLLHATFAGAQTESRGNLDGVWSTMITSFDDPAWRLEDHLCNTDCSAAGHAYAQTLLRDAENDSRPLAELRKEVQRYNLIHILLALRIRALVQLWFFDAADDPVIQCEPAGFFRQATARLSMRIDQYPDRVIMQYENWDATRTVYLNDRSHSPDQPATLLGHSIGWYEGPTLVIETTGILPHLISSRGLLTGERARGVERYTPSEDGRRLEVQLTIDDPSVFSEPMLLVESRVRSTHQELLDYECEVISGTP